MVLILGLFRISPEHFEVGWVGLRECNCKIAFEYIMPLFYFQLFEVLRGVRSSSPELRSAERRNESFWDGLGLEIYGVRPRFLVLAQYFACAQHTFRSFHINPTWNELV